MNSDSDVEIRERCYGCFRPESACFCNAIPTIFNHTHVLILQHVKERFHAFNTARIVRKSLTNCDLIVDQTPALATRDFHLQPDAGVLYPGDNARLLTDVPASQRPSQLVILDGTWHHAKTFMRDIPVLQQLPRFCLAPQRPSDYRIRKEPTESSLSTVEATVQALQALEPETIALEELLSAFRQMVDEQIVLSGDSVRRRHRSPAGRPPLNVPSILMKHPSNIVVAYGEVSYGQSGVRRKNQSLIYWVAQRLETGECFESAIRPDEVPSAEFLDHLQLPVTCFREAPQRQDFRRSWAEFLRPTDTLCVFNESTLRCLRQMDVAVGRSISLKSVNHGHSYRNLDETVHALDLTLTPVTHRGRAGQRLANAVSYARYLQSYGESQREPGGRV